MPRNTVLLLLTALLFLQPRAAATALPVTDRTVWQVAVSSDYGAAAWPCTGGSGERRSACVTLPSAPVLSWELPLAGTSFDASSSPVVDSSFNTYLCANCVPKDGVQANVYCVTHDGELRWQAPLKAEVYTQPVLLADGSVLVYDGKQMLHSYTPLGSLRWSQQFNARWAINAQPLPDPADGFYILDDAPAVLRCNNDGSVRWTSKLPSAGIGSLSRSQFTLFVPAGNGSIYVFETASGTLKATWPSGGNSLYWHLVCAQGLGVYTQCNAKQDTQVTALEFGGAGSFSYPSGLIFPTPLALSIANSLLFTEPRLGADGTLINALGRLKALDLSGKLLWQTDLPAQPLGQLLVDEFGRCCMAFQPSENYTGGFGCVGPDHQLEWQLPRTGGCVVFPIEINRLGVLSSAGWEGPLTLSTYGSFQ